MEESALLDKVCRLEAEYHLNNESILGIPLWRIVRYHTRLYYINKQTGYVATPPVSAKIGIPRLKIISGFTKYRRRDELSLFFPFNRLVQINGLYFDKFIDPVIIESNLSQANLVIVDPPGYLGSYSRENKDKTLANENRTLHQQCLKYLYKLITPIKYGRAIKRLFTSAKEAFDLPEHFINAYYHHTAVFLARYNYYLFWFRILKPKRIFVVYREGYFPQIAACKKLGIPVAEFQHGITLDNTVSYAGDYDARIDPDYFLTFGEFWKGPQFGMPLDRIVNIGWAYSKYLSHKVSDKGERHANEVLVISSPEISDAILDTLATLSDAQGDFSFHIRLHPCESYSDAQKEKLSKISKAIVVDNKIDSAIVLPTYKYVVGENSSVIYEALSVGCKVGMLNMCGLRPAVDLPGIKDSFFIISSISDFESFMQGDCSMEHTGKGFYSEFDNKRFMDFVNTSM